MLELIIQILSYIKQISYFGLVISYKTGRLIVYGLRGLIEILVHIHKSVGAVLRVLLEDFYIFVCDVGQRLLFIFTFITEVIQGFIDCATSIFETIKLILFSVIFAITETYNAVFTTIAKVFTGIGQICTLIKYFILLVGSGIWFALTVVPLFLVYTCTMFTYYLGCFADELIKFTTNVFMQFKFILNTIYEFLMDVPLESLAGLIAGASIIYIVIKFQILVYQKLILAFELIKHNLQQFRSSLTRRLRRQRQPPTPPHSSSETEQTDSNDDESSDDYEPNNMECAEDRACIICQERNKCILMLPCRHVCLCYVCNNTLRNYNRTCPVCRTVVQKTMKVFV